MNRQPAVTIRPLPGGNIAGSPETGVGGLNRLRGVAKQGDDRVGGEPAPAGVPLFASSRTSTPGPATRIAAATTPSTHSPTSTSAACGPLPGSASPAPAPCSQPPSRSSNTPRQDTSSTSWTTCSLSAPRTRCASSSATGPWNSGKTRMRSKPRPPAGTSADIVASPAETPVTRPDDDTVATAGALDSQVALLATCAPLPLDETVA